MNFRNPAYMEITKKEDDTLHRNLIHHVHIDRLTQIRFNTVIASMLKMEVLE